MTGTGKTALVQDYLTGQPYLYLNCCEAEWDLSSLKPLPENTKVPHHVVIDDMHLLRDEQRVGEVLSLLDRRDCWVVLISRSNVPYWLSSRRAKSELIIIEEADLLLTAFDLEDLSGGVYGISLSDAQAERLLTISGGIAFVAADVLAQLNGDDLDKEMSRFSERLNSYVEEQVMSEWPSDLQDFIMRVSVVDAFTLPLAEAITGDDHAASFLDEARQVANFLVQDGSTYSLRYVEAARRKARKKLGSAEICRCLYNAGHWYELNNELEKALICYETAGEQESINSLLIRNARRNPGNGFYYELRKYYLALPEKTVEQTPALMSALSMLYSLLMDAESSEKWYAKLKKYAQCADSVNAQEAYNDLVYLDIALPHRGTAGLAEIFKTIPNLIRSRGVQISVLSITNNQPSQMDGGKDFSDWSKKDRFLAETLGPIVTRFLGAWGKGLVSNGLGESFYEKGMDNYTVLSYLSQGRSESESGGTIEQTFVSVGLQVRLSRFSGNLRNARQLLDGFEHRVRREKAFRLLPNLEALRCRIELTAGDMDAVRRWLEKAPDETDEFRVLQRYEYLTKVRCYLAEARYMEAQTLLMQLRYYAEYTKRPHLIMEIGMFESILKRRTALSWQETFLDVLRMAQEYRFLRFLSEQGAAVLPLLKEIKKEYLSLPGADAKWFESLMSETKLVAGQYPNYLSSGVVTAAEFSPQALEILRMQAAGKTLKEISAELGIALRTVKYHAAENYAKLEANGKTDAVQKAKQLKLI